MTSFSYTGIFRTKHRTKYHTSRNSSRGSYIFFWILVSLAQAIAHFGPGYYASTGGYYYGKCGISVHAAHMLMLWAGFFFRHTRKVRVSSKVHHWMTLSDIHDTWQCSKIQKSARLMYCWLPWRLIFFFKWNLGQE